MVHDNDLNFQENVVDSVSVQSQTVWVTTSYPTPGDKEYVGLTETGENTGIFTGTLNTSSSTQVLGQVFRLNCSSLFSLRKHRRNYYDMSLKKHRNHYCDSQASFDGVLAPFDSSTAGTLATVSVLH
jgi:hypothetical protein